MHVFYISLASMYLSMFSRSHFLNDNRSQAIIWWNYQMMARTLNSPIIRPWKILHSRGCPLPISNSFGMDWWRSYHSSNTPCQWIWETNHSNQNQFHPKKWTNLLSLFTFILHIRINKYFEGDENHGSWNLQKKIINEKHPKW